MLSISGETLHQGAIMYRLSLPQGISRDGRPACRYQATFAIDRHILVSNLRRDVCSWPKADIDEAPLDVSLRGQSGHFATSTFALEADVVEDLNLGPPCTKTGLNRFRSRQGEG